MTSNRCSPKKRHGRRPQFTLRQLLVVLLFVSLALGFLRIIRFPLLVVACLLFFLGARLANPPIQKYVRAVETRKGRNRAFLVEIALTVAAVGIVSLVTVLLCVLCGILYTE